MKKTCIFSLAAILATTFPVFASDDDTTRVTFDEITVLGNRQTEQLMHLPGTVSVLTQESIERADAMTTGDVLAKSGLLNVQKSQQGGGSPSIRGFEASRILLVVDGVKMNNLIYRAGHLQNIITVDPGSLERMEIMYGPASVAYGSDALGGVVVMSTPAPKLSTAGSCLNVFGDLSGRYNSINNGSTFHGDLNIGGSKFASYTSLTYNNFGDLRSGKSKNPFLPDGDSYIYRPYTVDHVGGMDFLVVNNKYWQQPGTAYQQYDILQKLLFRPSEGFRHLLNLQFSNSTDVPRYDRLTDMSKGKPKFAQWYYGPQTRLLAAYSLNTAGWLGADEANLNLSYQLLKESRHNRKLNDPLLGSRCERVNVVSLSTDWIKYLGENRQHRLHAGLDGSLQFLKSTAKATNIDTGERKPLDTRYPDGDNHMHNIDLFVAHTWNISPSLTMTDGVRVGYSSLRSTFLTDEFYPFASMIGTVKQDNPTYSVSLGLAYNPAPTWKLGLNVSTGYRVPNIDDLAKVFDSEPGTVIMPNPDVRPEQTLNADINVATFRNNVVEWTASVFGTYMFDAITLAPGTFQGKDEIDYDGTPSKIFTTHNSSRAYVVGFQTSARAWMGRNFGANANLTYTYGNYLGSDDMDSMPLDHVAPLYGKIGVDFTTNDRRFNAEFYSLFNARKAASKYNLSGEDNMGYATVYGRDVPADFEGMPAWFTLNLRAQYRPDNIVTIEAGIDNILDTEYRVFASGINAPGRNFFASVKLSF